MSKITITIDHFKLYICIVIFKVYPLIVAHLNSILIYE